MDGPLFSISLNSYQAATPTLRCVAEFGTAGDGRDSCILQTLLPLQLQKIRKKEKCTSHSTFLCFHHHPLPFFVIIIYGSFFFFPPPQIRCLCWFIGDERRLLQISWYCSRAAYGRSWDTSPSLSCLTAGWDGSTVSHQNWGSQTLAHASSRAWVRTVLLFVKAKRKQQEKDSPGVMARRRCVLHCVHPLASASQ